MNNVKSRTTVRTRTIYEQSLDYESVRQALNLPVGARIYIRVPSGGDYCGIDLEIDDLPNGLQVQWSKESEETR